MGTPCVGKTSVSRRLEKQLDGVHVDLGELVAKEKLAVGVDKKRGSLIADRAVLARRVREMIKLHGKSHDVIVDGHYATDVVSPKDVARVFVLRRHPEELRKLMEKRGFKGCKLWENLVAEILDVCLYDAVQAVGLGKVCEIDVTGKGSEEVAEDIVLVLDGKKPCFAGFVDWLGQLEQEGRLDEYLKEF